jgi:hypothetical protein
VVYEKQIDERGTMTSNVAANLPSATTPPSPPQASTPKFVSWIVGVLGVVTLLAMSYKTAVDALDAAKEATKKALAAEPVTEASYNELSKTVNDLSDQLKATQTEVRILAEYIQTRPIAALAGTAAHPAFHAPPIPSASAGLPAAPATAASASLPSMVERLKTVEARPAVKLPTFDAIRLKARPLPPTE